MGLGAGERVGKHQRSVRELAAGSVGCEEGWRRELRGSLGGDGANGGGGGRFRAEGQMGLGSRARSGGGKDEDASGLERRV